MGYSRNGGLRRRAGDFPLPIYVHMYMTRDFLYRGHLGYISLRFDWPKRGWQSTATVLTRHPIISKSLLAANH
jgi:hypothetical protein